MNKFSRIQVALDNDFVGGSDQVTYIVDVQGRQTPLTISTWLMYQPVSYPFATDLRQDGTALIQRFAGYYDRADKSPPVAGERPADSAVRSGGW